MVISGLPEVDVEDMRANTVYEAPLHVGSALITWFWRAVRSFNQEQRVKLVQFVTGTGKIPVGGFANLIGMKYDLLFHNPLSSLLFSS
jgi:E3 ubiquitin-protein ligase HUWE1